MTHWKLALWAGAATFGLAGAALADTTPAPAAEAPAPAPMTTPAMSVPLSANPNPTSFDVGPLGKIYITGAVTGLALTQDNAAFVDEGTRADLSNGQVFIQKT